MTTKSSLLESDIKQMNSFLRGEISAVETYRHAIEKNDTPKAEPILLENQQCHAGRAALLRDEIASLGGEPAQDSGVWGTFAKAIEGTGALFGDAAAVAALEEGEDHGLADYRGDLEDLSGPAQSFVRTKLLPRQQETHDRASRLKDMM